MAEVRNIAEAEMPSPYSNHVLIQRTKNGTVLASGASHVSGDVDWYAPPHFTNMEEALAASTKWAEQNAVEIIYVCEHLH